MEAVVKRSQTARGVSTVNAAKTHCVKGHPLSGDNLKMKVRSNHPPSRACKICARASSLAGYHRNPHVQSNAGLGVVRRVIEALQEGRTLNSINGFGAGGKYVGGKITNSQRLKKVREANPKLDRLINKLNEKNLAATNERRLMSRRVASSALLNSGDAIFARLRAAVARLPEEIREDVFQNMAVAVLERRIPIDKIEAHVRSHVTGQYRDYGNRFRKFGSSTLVSLDQTLSEDSTTTIGETISQGFWQLA